MNRLVLELNILFQLIINFQIMPKVARWALQPSLRLLFMSGEPINEPIFGMGPFVMNTKEEIYQVYSDFSSGKLK